MKTCTSPRVSISPPPPPDINHVQDRSTRDNGVRCMGMWRGLQVPTTTSPAKLRTQYHTVSCNVTDFARKITHTAICLMRDALPKNQRESLKTPIGRQDLSFAGLLVCMQDNRLRKCVVSGQLKDGAKSRQGRRKTGGQVRLDREHRVIRAHQCLNHSRLEC